MTAHHPIGMTAREHRGRDDHDDGQVDASRARRAQRTRRRNGRTMKAPNHHAALQYVTICARIGASSEARTCVATLIDRVGPSRRARGVSPRSRRRSDKPAAEPPSASRQQVVRLGQLAAPRRRPHDEARALELQQRPEGVQAVGYEVRLAAMRERDARGTQPGRPEPEAQYAERLRVQAGGETAKVLAHNRERRRPDVARG